MQISGSNYSLYSSSFANKSSASTINSEGQDSGSFYSDLADYNQKSNTLFQKLLQNKTVQDNVTLNEDGTYSFKGELSSAQENLAKLLIEQQNGDISIDPGSTSQYSTNDLAKFRQLTGYNLIQAGGMYTVVDDHGNAPASRDQATVQAAWDMFDLAKGAQDLETPGADLSLEDLKSAAEGLRSQPGANQSMFDALIGMIEAELSTPTSESQ